jgi:hypothetical protein
VSEQEPELLMKNAMQIDVSEELLEDYAGMSELLGKALRGEIRLKPLPPPRRHRCLACWLASLLPGHDRCRHGYMTCDDCASDY